MSKKTTSKKAASAASKVLRDKRTSKASKTAAGSALSQRVKNLRGRESNSWKHKLPFFIQFFNI